MKAHRPGEILVVDGNSEFLSFAAQTLQRRGHAVRVCAYGSQAKSHLESHFFDAVLVASQLPDESGAHFCAWIKSHEDLQGLPVGIVLDAAQVKNPDNPLAEIGGAVGVGEMPLGGPLAPDDFILRPVRAEEFAIRVGALLKLRRYREEIGNSITMLLSIAEGVEEQDKRSAGHCRRLAMMAVLLGSALGCDEYQLLSLERAGFLHDIGKVSIPGAILEKSQPLTPREIEVIQEHCILGEKLCQGVMALQPVLPIIRHHHERGDGSGYPDKLHAERIPRLAQLFSIVDVYDSLRTWRPYRPPLDQRGAINVMRNEVAQGHWNREMFEAFAAQVVPMLDDHFRTSRVMWSVG